MSSGWYTDWAREEEANKKSKHSSLRSLNHPHELMTMTGFATIEEFNYFPCMISLDLFSHACSMVNSF